MVILAHDENMYSSCGVILNKVCSVGDFVHLLPTKLLITSQGGGPHPYTMEVTVGEHMPQT